MYKIENNELIFKDKKINKNNYFYLMNDITEVIIDRTEYFKKCFKNKNINYIKNINVELTKEGMIIIYKFKNSSEIYFDCFKFIDFLNIFKYDYNEYNPLFNLVECKTISKETF